MNMIPAGQSLDATKMPTSREHATIEKPRKSLLNKDGTISTNGFDTKFYQRRDTLTYYKPPMPAANTTAFTTMQSGISPEKDPKNSWTNMKTT